MVEYIKNKENNEYPSLYDTFELGDRVKRTYKDENGKSRTYKGIILSINNRGIEVYWDTINDKYRPRGMDLAFSHCKLEEIFKGNSFFTPIEKG